MDNDTTNENLDSINETEVTVDTESTENTTNEETTQESDQVDVSRLQETNKKLFERAKKAEAELKALKISPAQPKKDKAPSQPTNVEETVLLAQGLPEELLNELKAVATVRGTSLIKAQTDPIFIAVKEKFESDIKSKKASVGVSRGSSSVKPKKDFNTPGLTREEHMTMFNETQR